jgi:phosphoserine phosphatase RsbU/P
MMKQILPDSAYRIPLLIGLSILILILVAVILVPDGLAIGSREAVPGISAGFLQDLGNGSFVVLLQLMGVIVVVAYLLTRSRIFPEILEGRTTLRTQLILILVFGALSIYGSMSGIELKGSFINVRDLGPLVAGLLAGPYVGIGAGIIGGLYRLTLGGFTVAACSVSAVFAGLFGGLVWLHQKKKFCGITVAVLLAILMELFHMALILALSRPFERALDVVSVVVLPMILANAVGIFIFAFMVRNLENERRMQAERDALLREMERKNTELAIAAEIQRDILPEPLFQPNGFVIAAKNIPAKAVGGDFYDVMPLDVPAGGAPKSGIMIADVSGKGMPAALFMALSQTVVQVLSSERSSPAELITAANGIISRRSRSGMFVTLFYGVLSQNPLSLSFINAGHNPPLVFRAGSGTVEELHATGAALGIAEQSRYREYSVPLSSGDIIVLYTDGITEAENSRGEMFGTERLVQLVRESTALSPQEIVDTVVGRVIAFAESEPQFDDITIMVIRAR